MSPLCVWTDRRVAVGSRSRPVTRSLLSIFHGPVTLRVQTQAARSLWYTLKPEGVSIAHIKLLHSVIYRVSLWAPSVSLHYRRMRADSPASPPPHVQTCWIWCHECEFGSNNNKKIIPVVLLSLPTDLMQKYNVFRAQLNDVKCDFRVDGMSNKRNLEPPSFPLPAVFTLFTPAPNLVLLLGNNMNFLPAGVWPYARRYLSDSSVLSLPVSLIESGSLHSCIYSVIHAHRQRD